MSLIQIRKKFLQNYLESEKIFSLVFVFVSPKSESENFQNLKVIEVKWKWKFSKPKSGQDLKVRQSYPDLEVFKKVSKVKNKTNYLINLEW